MKQYRMGQTSVTCLCLVFCIGLAACNKPGESDAAQAKNDSLFLGLSLGMKRQAFYDTCWEHNRNKVLTQGPTKYNVQYKLVSNVKNPVTMRFYPTFHEDKIFEMPVTFSYDNWAPWNKQFWADSLLNEVLPVFKDWYGSDFKSFNHPTMGIVYYKIDGKRRINLFKKDDQFVQAIFTDLAVEKKLKEAYAKKLEAEKTTSE